MKFFINVWRVSLLHPLPLNQCCKVCNFVKYVPLGDLAANGSHITCSVYFHNIDSGGRRILSQNQTFLYISWRWLSGYAFLLSGQCWLLHSSVIAVIAFLWLLRNNNTMGVLIPPNCLVRLHVSAFIYVRTIVSLNTTWLVQLTSIAF